MVYDLAPPVLSWMRKLPTVMKPANGRNTRNDRRFLALFALSLPSPVLAVQAEGAAARPHLVLFLVDDLGWQDVSVSFTQEPTPYNRRYRTPHLERLAREGMRFTQGYASAPVCTPTRTSIQTGLSPAASQIKAYSSRSLPLRINWTIIATRVRLKIRAMKRCSSATCIG